jgi:hypothetical protein
LDVLTEPELFGYVGVWRNVLWVDHSAGCQENLEDHGATARSLLLLACAARLLLDG